MGLASDNLRPFSRGQRALLTLAGFTSAWTIVVLLTGGVDVTLAGVRVRATEWLDPAAVAIVALLFFARSWRQDAFVESSSAATERSFRWQSADGAGLMAILVVATAVRVWGLGFGLPHPEARPDEGAVAAIAAGFMTGHFEPPDFKWPPLYILLVATMLWLLFNKGRDILARFGIHRALPPISLRVERIMARMISAAAGVFSVWLLFRIGDRLFGRATALAAALFLALAFLHVRDSHFGVTDVTMTTLVLAGFLPIVRYSESGRLSDLVSAAIVSGLAAATKYNAALLVLPASFAILTAPGSQTPQSLVRRLGVFVGLLLIVFVVICPYALITPQKFLSDVLFDSRHLMEGQGADLGRGWTYHMTTSLRYGLGLPLLGCGIFGLLTMVWREGRPGILVALYPIAYYFVIGGGRTVFARYVLPLVPFLCLAAGYVVVLVAQWVAGALRRPRAAPALIAALAAAVVVPSAQSVIAFDRVLAREDSRAIARRWIESRFPPGTSLAQWGQPNAQVYLDFEIAYHLSPIVRSERPTLVAIASGPTNPLPDLHAFLPFLERDYDLAFVVEAAPEYNPANVYDLQDEFFLPLTGFRDIERPGPNLRIFVRR